MNKTHLRVTVIVVLLLLVCSLFIPFDTELVPRWQLKVVDRNGSVLSNVAVEQSWEHYAYSESSFPQAKGYESRRSDNDGIVVFPPKYLRASAASRVFYPALATILLLAHGSSGLSINARVFDEPRNYFSNSSDMIFTYSQWGLSEPLPNTIIATPGD